MSEASNTPPHVRPDVRQFLDYVNALPGPKTHELPPEAARQLYLAMRDVADLPSADIAITRDLSIPANGGAIPARLFDCREKREPGPVILFFHGGGFVIGSIDTHAGFCIEMSRMLDLPVVSVDYRLAPEHRWPSAPDDCEAAARWVADSPDALGLSVTGLVLCGDSAGGTLAIVAAIDLRDRPASAPVIAQLPIYPAADAAGEYPSMRLFEEGHLLTRETMAWFSDHYAADLSHMRGSPMTGDLTGLPPAVVLTAGLDPIRDQGRAYAAALANAGVPVVFREAVGNIHGFITLRQAVPSSQGDVAGFLIAAKQVIAEAEANRVMAQAAG